MREREREREGERERELERKSLQGSEVDGRRWKGGRVKTNDLLDWSLAL